jgi:plasmid stabilization system protein ParE
VAEVRFHLEAQEEFEVALTWYQARSPRASARFEAELDRALDGIVANPALFPAYDDEHRFAMLRRFPFSVVYQVQADSIYVVALAHSRRSPGYWRGRA